MSAESVPVQANPMNTPVRRRTPAAIKAEKLAKLILREASADCHIKENTNGTLSVDDLTSVEEVVKFLKTTQEIKRATAVHVNFAVGDVLNSMTSRGKHSAEKDAILNIMSNGNPDEKKRLGLYFRDCLKTAKKWAPQYRNMDRSWRYHFLGNPADTNSAMDKDERVIVVDHKLVYDGSLPLAFHSHTTTDGIEVTVVDLATGVAGILHINYNQGPMQVSALRRKEDFEKEASK